MLQGLLIIGAVMLIIALIVYIIQSSEAERAVEKIRSLTAQVEACVRDVPALERELGAKRRAVEQRANQLHTAISTARSDIGFHGLCDLHYESVQVANACMQHTTLRRYLFVLSKMDLENCIESATDYIGRGVLREDTFVVAIIASLLKCKRLRGALNHRAINCRTR